MLEAAAACVPLEGEEQPATPTRKGTDRPPCRPGRGAAVYTGDKGGDEVEAPAEPTSEEV